MNIFIYCLLKVILRIQRFLITGRVLSIASSAIDIPSAYQWHIFYPKVNAWPTLSIFDYLASYLIPYLTDQLNNEFSRE